MNASPVSSTGNESGSPKNENLLDAQCRKTRAIVGRDIINVKVIEILSNHEFLNRAMYDPNGIAIISNQNTNQTND